MSDDGSSNNRLNNIYGGLILFSGVAAFAMIIIFAIVYSEKQLVQTRDDVVSTVELAVIAEQDYWLKNRSYSGETDDADRNSLSIKANAPYADEVDVSAQGDTAAVSLDEDDSLIVATLHRGKLISVECSNLGDTCSDSEILSLPDDEPARY